MRKARLTEFGISPSISISRVRLEFISDRPVQGSSHTT
jgi:hypothetical protein